MVWSEKMAQLELILVVVISWGMAFFEYCLQVPANRMGYQGNGGPFSLMQLKLLQQVISLGVFLLFMLVFFKQEPLTFPIFRF